MTITELAQTPPPAIDAEGATGDPQPYRGEQAAPPPGAIEETLEAARRGLADGTLLWEVLIPDLGHPEDSMYPFLSQAQEAALTREFRRLIGVAERSAARLNPRGEVADVYENLSMLLRTTVLGVRAHWPETFWGTTAARLLYVAFYAAYGEHDPATGVPNGLMLNKDVRKLTDLGLPRIGQVQRYGQFDYIENPWVTHHKQRRRRTTPDMLRVFLADFPPSGGLAPETLAGVRIMAQLRAQARRGELALDGAGEE